MRRTYRAALRRALALLLMLPAAALAAPPAATPKAPAKPASATKAAPATKPAAKPAAPRARAAARPSDPWALVIAGRDKDAEDAFGGRLTRNPGDLQSAIGLAALLDARDDSAGAQLALVRALEKSGLASPEAAGAFAALVLLSSRTPDGGAAAMPLLAGIVEGRVPYAYPEIRGLALQALAGALGRAGRPDEGIRVLTGPGGQVTQWTLIGPYGRFDRLDLLRPFPPESGDFDPAHAHSVDGLPAFRIDTTFADGRVVVPTQFRTTGLVYAVADVAVARPVTLRVSASSPASFRLFVDGKLALTSDRVRQHPPAEAGLRAALSAGRHRFIVKLANSGRFTPLSLAFEPLTGQPALAGVLRSVPVEGAADGTGEVSPWPAPLDDPPPVTASSSPAAAVAANWWLRARDLDERVGVTLAAARSAWPKSPLFALLYGEWAMAARTGKSVDEDLAQARTLLGEAATADPHFARARLLVARMDENAGQLSEAWSAAEAVLGVSPEDPDALALQHRVAVKRGWEVEAEQRIERARAAAPRRIDVLEQAIDLYRKTGAATKLEAALAEKARRDPFDEAWADFLTNAGRTAEARAAWEHMRALRPSYVYPYFGLARLLMDGGEADQALAVLDEARKMFPGEAMVPFRRAGALAMEGKDDAVTAELRHALDLDPSRIEIWESLVRRGEKDQLAPWLGDAREVLRAAPRPQPGTDSALLADIASVLVDPQGGQTELYQGVHAVYTRAGVEREGELDVLPGARLQGIRIHKKSGGYADVQVGDKRPVSLPGLEPGDSIEYIWRRYIPSYDPVPGSIDNRTLFLFQGQDREYVLSRYVIVHDQRLPVEACGNFAGLATTDETQGPFRVRSWTARSMPRLAPEPHMADALEVIPNVRLGLNMTWQDVGELVKSALAGLLQPDPPLPGMAADIRKRAGSDDPLALARALHEIVRDRIRPGNQALSIGTPASVSASAGEGNRVVVALALAQMLKLPARLVLARPVEQRGRQLDCPSPQAFGYALVQLDLPGRQVFLDYAEADHPFDSFPARLGGADALEIPLGLDEAAKIVDLPRRETVVLEESDAKVALGGDGRVAGTLVLTARGSTGAVLRRVIREIPADQRQNVFRQVAGESFAGATVVEGHIAGQDDPEGDLKITVRFTGGSWGRRTPTGFALPVVRRPLGLLAEYASLPERQTAELLDAQEYRRDTIDVEYPEGFSPSEVPPPLTRGEKYGGYSLLVKREPRHLVVVRNAVIPAGRIEPAEYPQFREFARAIDEAESREIGLSASSPSLVH